MIRRLVLFFGVLALVWAPAMVCAQYSGALGLSGLPSMASFFGGSGSPSDSVIPNQEGMYLTLGLRKYINSFTSYQFPDAPGFDIGSDPISRLEWPWEQTFGVVKLGKYYRGLQVNFEGSATLFKDSGLLAQDSDWEDPARPSQKTTFSDGLAMPRNWMIDTSVGFTVPALQPIQWLLGYRAQQFRFTYTDITQRSIWPVAYSEYSPGEGIQFSQYYKIYYAGGALAGQFDLGRSIASLTAYNLFLKLQGDVGYVTGNNVDFHVLRDPGPRFTYEYTSGICWHLNLAAECRYKEIFSLGLAGDFMSIRTSGSHSWTQPGVALSWDGARVWSEQKYIEANASLIF